MNNKIYGYARVSTKEQNLDRQIAALLSCGVSERDIITDKASGKDFNRTGYAMLKEHILRSGDTLIVKSLDRLGRNKQQVKDELEALRTMGIRIKIIDLPTTMIDLDQGNDWVLDMVNNILIEVLGTIAEQERATTKARQAEGIAVAKAKGKKLGRPKLKYPEKWEYYYSEWKKGSITVTQIIKETGISRTSFYRLVKKYEN